MREKTKTVFFAKMYVHCTYYVYFDLYVTQATFEGFKLANLKIFISS